MYYCIIQVVAELPYSCYPERLFDPVSNIDPVLQLAFVGW